MKVTGATLADLQTIASEVGVRIAQRNNYGASPKTHTRRDGRPETTFTLRTLYSDKPQSVAYRRTSNYTRADGKPRTIGGILCWHGHRDFMAALFARFPQAILSSCMAKYEGVEGFKREYPGTAYQNIGSQYHPLYISDACYCDNEGHDSKGLPVKACGVAQ